jgi:anaerobic magnesium-protoporphyrin IX monomethyl ester cyclase
VTRVLIGQSYYLRFDTKLWRQMQPYAPLGSLYAAADLRRRGHDVSLFDAMLATSENDWAVALDHHRPEVAVIFEDNFNYLSKMCLSRMRDAAFRMIGMARQRGCTVVVAGSDPTDHADRYLGRGAHFVLRGEGEETLGELLDLLAGRRDGSLAAIRGLSYLADGDVMNTPARPDFRDLDALPFPAWDLVDVPRYRAIWQSRHGYYSMNVATSRGCPFHCNWCAKPIWGQRYNVRSPEGVVSELAWLRQTYQPDHVWFVDDIFGLKPGWVQRFADLVECEGVRIPFKSLQRVDLLLKGDTVAAMRRAGARTVWVGAESGSQKILDAMDKGTRVEDIREASRRLHAAGIEVAFFLQFGYPGETREDVEKTLALVRECRPDDLGVSVSYPLPGTKFFHAVQQELGIKQNWVDSNDLAMLYRGPYTTAFYRTLHRVVHHEFRARKNLDELRAALRHPRRLRPSHARRAASLLAHRLALPIARWQLDRLAHLPHQPLAVSPRQLSASEAARPSPQEHEPRKEEHEHVEAHPAG